jgi:hypothetical protein
MKNENALLQALFPDEYWNYETGEPIRYVFTKEKYERLISAGILYLIAAIAGEETGTGSDKERSELGKKIRVRENSIIIENEFRSHESCNVGEFYCQKCNNLD